MPKDGLWGADGERLQSHLRRNLSLRNRSVTGGFTGLELGLVVARHYPDDDNNVGKRVTEYDALMLAYQLTLRNLVVKMPYQGVLGGQQVTYTPATTVPDFRQPDDVWRSFMESDGDLVAIQYIGRKWPVIDGCMNHLRTSGSNDWHTDSTDGAVDALTYNSTRMRVNQDGNLEIDFDDSSGSHDRSLIINVDGTQFLRVTQDAGTGDVRIELGSGATLEKIVLGESFQTFFDTDVAGHTHAAGSLLDGGGIPCSGATAPAVPNLDVTVLTDKVKAEK